MNLNNLAQLWLAKRCLGCEQPNELELCVGCEAALAPTLVQFTRAANLFPTNSQPAQVITGFAIFEYESLAARIIHDFKQTGSKELAKLLARIWVRHCAVAVTEQVGAEKRLLLVGAPSRTSATRSRGFVPAQLLANALAGELRRVGIAASSADALWFAAEVQDQSQLKVDSRHDNLRGKMRATITAKSRASDCVIAFVDDVVTTGATAIEACRALAEAGKMPRFLFAIAETKQKIAHAI